jgi:hypothetical protein
MRELRREEKEERRGETMGERVTILIHTTCTTCAINAHLGNGKGNTNPSENCAHYASHLLSFALLLLLLRYFVVFEECKKGLNTFLPQIILVPIPRRNRKTNETREEADPMKEYCESERKVIRYRLYDRWTVGNKKPRKERRKENVLRLFIFSISLSVEGVRFLRIPHTPLAPPHTPLTPQISTFLYLYSHNTIFSYIPFILLSQINFTTLPFFSTQ